MCCWMGNGKAIGGKREEVHAPRLLTSLFNAIFHLSCVNYLAHQNSEERVLGTAFETAK